LSQVRATPNGVFGAKLLYRQLLHLESLARQEPELAELSLPEILDRLFPNLHLVWVTREDKVRQAISWFKARQTGVWGQDQGQSAPKLGRAWRLGDEPLEPGELAFDYDGIAALVRQAEAEDAAIGQFFATSGIEPFRVVYEEFTPRYEETILALLRWLGVTLPRAARCRGATLSGVISRFVDHLVHGTDRAPCSSAQPWPLGADAAPRMR
ncbi:MAG: hypothetical protein K0S78_6243, partial [Thermomicrobiales bacterium]|nr:hypothetical protein [Thermomicrobiales bacterium]